ncbi:hypothetical protein ABH924_001151 [Arthrobacter sp. GAS37]|uniref:hypothetical protein n=1 Tax=Arthrobacter sp. GAS37 TaxID=3156261 RepID=UPI003835C17E
MSASTIPPGVGSTRFAHPAGGVRVSPALWGGCGGGVTWEEGGDACEELGELGPGPTQAASATDAAAKATRTRRGVTTALPWLH